MFFSLGLQQDRRAKAQNYTLEAILLLYALLLGSFQHQVIFELMLVEEHTTATTKT